MMHVALGGQAEESERFFDAMAQYGVEYDIIGQSYYPEWHGTLEELEATGASDVMAHAIDPAAALGLSTHELTDYERDAAAVGERFGCRQVVDANGGERQPHEGEHICLVRDGLLRGVWELRDGHMACVSNFPEGIGGVVR
jgi:hypothetical protein